MSNPLLDKIDSESNILPEAILNDEQKNAILERWNSNLSSPPSIHELILIAWPNLPKEHVDARLKWGKVIKKFLINSNINILQHEENKSILLDRNNISLTTEQQDYIRNNCSNMGPFEMAKVVFKNQSLSPASNEMKLVAEYLKTLDPKLLSSDENINFDYRPPKTLSHVLARIRKYVSETEKWDIKNLTSQQKKNCEMLIHYLHDLRFKRQIDSYEKQEDKLTFESEFIKYVYDKSDLVQEEISQYISLCSFIVQEFNINSYLEMLKSQQQREYDENNRISSNLVDAIESARSDLDACVKRQSMLYNSLTQKRSEKVKGKLKDSASILNLIELWKNEESRKKMLQIANSRKELVSNEYDRLNSMEDIVVSIIGMSKDEALNG